jgi:hypothetical protein
LEPSSLLKIDKRVLEGEFNVLGFHFALVNIKLGNISHTKSRLPIPSRIVDSLVSTVLVTVDAHPFLEL